MQNQIADGGSASGCSSIDDEKESLHSEMLKLCYEIENANDGKSSGNESSVDLTYQEERVLHNIVDKVNEIRCDSATHLMMKTSRV